MKEQKGVQRLLAKLEADPNNADDWIQLFGQYEEKMSAEEREDYIRCIQDTFDDIDYRRAQFGCAIDGIYSDEEAYLENIEVSEAGSRKLCEYLRNHIDCERGFHILFGEAFEKVMDQQTKENMIRFLSINFNRDHLMCSYPQLFGYPDFYNDNDMYDSVSLGFLAEEDKV